MKTWPICFNSVTDQFYTSKDTQAKLLEYYTPYTKICFYTREGARDHYAKKIWYFEKDGIKIDSLRPDKLDGWVGVCLVHKVGRALQNKSSNQFRNLPLDVSAALGNLAPKRKIQFVKSVFIVEENLNGKSFNFSYSQIAYLSTFYFNTLLYIYRDFMIL